MPLRKYIKRDYMENLEKSQIGKKKNSHSGCGYCHDL